MGERDWRAQKREATRRRLTAAAFALFDERGYDVVSVGEIAHAAGVSVPTFYAYFRTKEHVPFPDQDPAWIEALLGAQPEDLPLPERVRRGLQAMLATLPPDEEHALLRRWQLALREPAVRSRVADREAASVEVLAAALGVDRADSDDAGSAGAARIVVVTACMAASTASFLRWAATEGRRPLPELVDEAFAALRSI